MIYTWALFIYIKSSIKRVQGIRKKISALAPQILRSDNVSFQTWVHSDGSQISYKRNGLLESAQSSECLLQTFLFPQAVSAENMWKISALHCMCENSFWNAISCNLTGATFVAIFMSTHLNCIFLGFTIFVRAFHTFQNLLNNFYVHFWHQAKIWTFNIFLKET